MHFELRGKKFHLCMCVCEFACLIKKTRCPVVHLVDKRKVGTEVEVMEALPRRSKVPEKKVGVTPDPIVVWAKQD